MSVKIKGGGAYADASGVFHKQGGVYSAVQSMFVKVGGVYQSVFSGDALAAIRKATTRRVDVVMLGDSNHFFGAYGFAWGLSRALSAKYGCYATGMICPTGPAASDPAPTEYQTQNGTDNGFGSSATGVNDAGFTALNNLWFTGANSGTNLIAPRSRWVPSTATANLGGMVLNEGHPIGLENALRWHVGYVRAPSGALAGGSVTPNLRYQRGATTVLATLPTISSTGGATEGVATSAYDLAAGSRTAGCDIVLRGAGGVAANAPFGYLFTRVENVAKTNGLSFHNLFATAGKCAYDMGMSLITHSSLSQLTSYFSEVRRLQLSAGQTPEVVIYINTNFNDNNPTKSPSPSLGPLAGSTAAGSAAAYIDNLTAIKNRILQVWTTNAWDTSELSWLFVPSFVGPNQGAELPVYGEFREALKASALAAQPKTSVIDLSLLTTQAAMIAAGWYNGQTGPGAAVSDVNMIHLTATTGANTTIASVGYDGMSGLIADLI